MITTTILVAFLASRAQEPRVHRPADPATSVRGLPARLGHDALRLVTTKTPVLVLAAGGSAAAAVHPADRRSVASLSSSSGADLFFDAGANAGDGIVQFCSALGVYGVALLAHNDRATQLGTGLVEAQIVNLGMTEPVKVIANRTRPNGGTHSFPSGHTSAAFATADVFQQTFGWRGGLPAYAGAVYVGISRLAEKQHFLSDVVFGAAVGIASARTLAVQTHGHRIAIVPAPIPGGAAIFIHAIPH